MKKRFWALFLAVMMIVSVLPTTAFADERDNFVTINKEAKRTGEDTWEITLTIETGDIEIKPEPMDLVILMDTSYSMKSDLEGDYPGKGNHNPDEVRMEIAGPAAQTLISNLASAGINARVAVVTFDSSASKKLDLTQLTTGNVNTVNNAIPDSKQDPSNSFGTNMTAGLNKAYEILETSTATNKVVVMLGDGEPYNDTDGSNGPKDTTLSKLSGKKIVVHTIGFAVNSRVLENIANKTNGNYYTTSSVDGLADIFTDIKNELVAMVSDDMRDKSSETYVSIQGKPDVPKDSSVSVTKDGKYMSWNPANGVLREEDTAVIRYTVELDDVNDFAPGNHKIKLNGDATLSYQAGNTTGKLKFPVPEADIEIAQPVTEIYLDDEDTPYSTRPGKKIIVWDEGKNIIEWDEPAATIEVGNETYNYYESTYNGAETEEFSAEVGAGGTYTLKHYYVSKPNTADYTVKHWFEKLDTTGEAKYEQLEAHPDETKSGNIGEETDAEAKTVTGFTAQAFKQDKIADDGSTVVNIYYDRNSYTVTYDYESDVPGQSDLPDTASYKYGQAVTVADAATAPGYTFSGWSQTGTFTMPAENVTITGSFTANTYDIIYMVDGVEYKRVEEVAYGTTITLIDEPSNTGYTFSGWGTTDVTVTSGMFNMPAKDVTITGSWIKLVTVTFDANGGAWGSSVNGYTMSGEPYNTAAISQTVGSQVNEIHPAPTLDDHTFTGWHFDTAATEEVNFTFAKAYSDVTLYAGWEEIKPGDVQYTVKQHFINQAGVEDLTLNYIGVFSAPAGSKIASLIDSFEKDTQTHVYKQAETKHNGQLLDREEATLAEGDVIDLYYYMDIWNDEKNTINEGDDIPDMYQAVVKFQAGDLYGTVEGTGIVQVFTLNAEKAADAISGQITPSVEDVNGVPNEGYAFDIWTMNDGETGVNPEAPITVQGGSITNFYAHFALDKIGGDKGGDGIPDKYQALVTYKVVNGTWSNGSSADIVKVFTLQEKNDNGVWADVAAVLGAMPTGMKPAAGYMTIGAWNKTHAADERPVHASVYTWTFTTRNAPDVTIAKYANKTSATVGETITYTIIVTNTGNVALTDLVVKDVFTQGGNGETVWTIASLAPGASQKIEFSYRTSNHDVGGLKNIAVVTGKGPDGGEVTDITQSVETDVYREHIVRPTRPALNKEDHYAYIVGYPDGLVHPEKNITRAEVSTIFFRMLLDESREDFWAQENWFSDVPADQWYNNAVSTLANAGLISGYPDGSFKPNANITRAEFATIAIRFFLEEDVEITENNLSDVKGHWAEANINLAYALNLINGYPDGTFRPDQKITRAEAMTIVNRVLERTPDKDHLLEDMIEWPDNMDKDMWYYADVQEATNSHEFYKTKDQDTEEVYEIWTELLPVRDWVALEQMWSQSNSSKNPGEVVDINITTP